MKRLRWAALVATMSVAPTLGAQTTLPQDWDAEVMRALRLFQVPGMAMAVVKDGKVLLARGYGVRRVEGAIPVDAGTYFQIASNTKAFTTALLAQLVDSGRLAWDDPVTKYLPWLVVKGVRSLTAGPWWKSSARKQATNFVPGPKTNP